MATAKKATAKQLDEGDGLDEGTQKELEACAKKINAAREQELDSIFVRGDELIKAHALLANHKNGKLWAWAKKHCRLGRSQGTRYMRAAKAVHKEFRATVAQYIDVTALWELTKKGVPENAMDGAIKAAIEGKHVRRKDAEGMIQIRREVERTRTVVEVPERVQLTCCDLREIDTKLSIEPASVDVVLTDPLYGRDDIWMYEAIAELSAKVLRPGGWCLCYAGKMFLDQVYAAMSKHLEYKWQFDVIHKEPTLIDAIKIAQGAKYVVGYRHQPTAAWWPPFSDRLEFAPEKYLGKLQQPSKEAAHLLFSLCPPGGTVLDPCCGTGSVGVACVQLGLSFIGGDIDPQMVEIARSRLAEMNGSVEAA